MLFSNKQISSLINHYFEASWESVRPVPTVTIDFGNDQVITRTLHGNIATYVCTGDGKVVDVLPGIYEPNVYHDELSLLYSLTEKLKSGKPRDQASRLQSYYQTKKQRTKKVKDKPTAILAKDTENNQTVRRQQIQDYLSTSNVEQPSQMQKWLYREVLHADLDDPYLGLSKVLFENYPFAEEDAQAPPVLTSATRSKPKYSN